jgi:SAM-dependent methyltransferase
MPALSIRLRRFLHGVRTEGEGPGRETAAVAVGVFIGCLPLYGLHLLICLAVGTVFRLNRLKTYLAANISNPLVAPWLLLAEVQTGAWIRRGSVHALTAETLQTTGLRVFLGDLVIGSLIVGGALACLAAWATFAVVRSNPIDRPFVDLVRRASDRYVGTSITAWEFARGKLRHDPIYRAAIRERLLPAAGGTLVDVGCGQGLTLALLSEVRRDVRAGHWPADWPSPPCFERLIGVEIRPRVAALAAEALRGEAEVVTGDARLSAMEQADVVLLFDVLHLMSQAEQEAVLASAASSLSPGGLMVIREADAAAGWRFTMVALGNRLKALAFGNWGQQFHFRTSADWEVCFSRLGLRSEARPMGQGTPFANVVFLVSRDRAA